MDHGVLMTVEQLSDHRSLDVLAAYVFTKEEEDTPKDGEEEVP